MWFVVWLVVWLDVQLGVQLGVWLGCVVGCVVGVRLVRLGVWVRGSWVCGWVCTCMSVYVCV